MLTEIIFLTKVPLLPWAGLQNAVRCVTDVTAKEFNQNNFNNVWFI